jgi:hypothetical protein
MVKKRASALAGAACALLVGLTGAPASAHAPQQAPRTVTDGLNGPRGVASVRPGVTLVSETDGTVSLVRERRHRAPVVRKLTRVPSLFAPGIAVGRHGAVYIVTGAATSPDPADPPPPADVAAVEQKLFVWHPGWSKPHLLADIGAYQGRDPDPYDLEDNPTDSNPFGVVALRNGSVLVSDAAGNDLLRVRPNGHISTVARLKPRVVTVPEGAGPPAGSQIPAEAVATSVTVGSDGYAYVGELRGFPATPGTSEIWRVNPNAHGALCDPEHPYKGSCRRYADGLTSVVDLAPGAHGSIYAVTLSKKSWLATESDPPVPGAEIGGLFKVSPWGHHIRELAKDQLTLPGGADTDCNGRILVTGPVFGPGALVSLRG